MKSFYISVIILILCFLAATANCIWSVRITDDLTRELETMTAGNTDDFIEIWRSAENILSLTSRQSSIREIEDEIQQLEAAKEAEDELEFESARNSLIYIMKELRRSHSFDIKTIL